MVEEIVMNRESDKRVIEYYSERQQVFIESFEIKTADRFFDQFNSKIQLTFRFKTELHEYFCIQREDEYDIYRIMIKKDADTIKGLS